MSDYREIENPTHDIRVIKDFVLVSSMGEMNASRFIYLEGDEFKNLRGLNQLIIVPEAF